MQTEPCQIDPGVYKLVDETRKHACWIDDTTARYLLLQKWAVPFGTKRKLHGFRLIVAMSTATESISHDRALSLSDFGTRFIFRSKISTERGVSQTFTLKKLHVTESPTWALNRIMRAPALESGVHKLIRECSDDERASDPGHARRKNSPSIFRTRIGFAHCHAQPAVA
jgi:hypothetical protein